MPDGRLANDPAPMLQEFSQRRRAAERVGRRKVRGDACHGGVELEHPALHALHEADIGEELGDRGDAEWRVGARRPRGVCGIDEAESLGPDDRVAIDQGDGESAGR